MCDGLEVREQGTFPGAPSTWLGLPFSLEDMEPFEELTKPIGPSPQKSTCMHESEHTAFRVQFQGGSTLTRDSWGAVAPKHPKAFNASRNQYHPPRIWRRDMGYLPPSSQGWCGCPRMCPGQLFLGQLPGRALCHQSHQPQPCSRPSELLLSPKSCLLIAE